MRATIFLLSLLLVACDKPVEKSLSHLERVKQKGELLVLTRNGPTTFYEGPEGPAGFEYDIAIGFAKYLGVSLRLKIPEKFSDILKQVESGQPDFAAAGLTVTEARKQRVNFGPSYQRITPQVVYRKGSRRPHDLSEIHGSLQVVAGSSHAERLLAMKQDYPDLIVQENLELDSEQLLNLVWENVIEYTVADSNEVEINRRFYPELRVAFNLSEAEPLAWAFPPGDDHSLIDQATTYFNQLRTTGRLDQLLERYYGHVNDFDYVETRRYLRHIEKRLPKYRDWFIKAGKKTKLDWRLLAAIGYQESHWNPRAVSPTGVRGIMMVTRSTMKQLGIENSRHDPEASIMGGSRYIKKIKRRIPDRIREPDRTWMALAAYNIGFGHLEDARKLAQAEKVDADKWVNLKTYLPRLSQKKWYKQTKYGYARGMEPVRYVENVRGYYDILVWLTERQQAAANSPSDFSFRPAESL